jgi:alcohol dehydrogenase
MASIEFQIPTNIICGADSLQKLSEIACPNNEKVVMVCEKKYSETGVTQRIKRLIEGYAYDIIIYEIPSFANTKDLFEGVNIAKSSRTDVVIGVGGENVLSVAKCIAQFSTQEVSKTDQKGSRVNVKKVRYIEVPAIQVVTWGIIPITYVIDETDSVRKPYSDKASYAEALIIDPLITEDVPLNDLIYSSLEGISYSFDAYISKKSNPISDSLSLKAIEYLSVNLKRLALEPANTKIKGNLSIGTLLASMAVYGSSPGLSAACAMGLSASSSTSQQIGSGVILPHVMEFNLTAAANKFIQIAMALGEKVADITVIEAAIMAIESIRRLMMDLHIPQRLMEYKIDQEMINKASQTASEYDFLSYSPRPAGRSEIHEIFSAAL